MDPSMAVRGASPSQIICRIHHLLNQRVALVALGALAVMVVMAYGYWYYDTTIKRPQELAELQQEANRLRRNLATLRRSVQDSSAPAQPAQTPGRTLGNSLLAPMDGIRSLDQLTRLAERTGVNLTIHSQPSEARESW